MELKLLKNFWIELIGTSSSWMPSPAKESPQAKIRGLQNPPKPPMGQNPTTMAKVTRTTMAMERMGERGPIVNLPPPRISALRAIVMNHGSLTTLPLSSLEQRCIRP